MKSSGTILSTKKGFTLVELIVVLALLAVLLAGVAGGLASYQKNAVLRRSNESAHTIYLAAQSALARAKAGGMLEKIAEEVEAERQAGTQGSMDVTVEAERQAGTQGSMDVTVEAERQAGAQGSADAGLVREAGLVPAEITGAAYPALSYIWKERGAADGLLCRLLDGAVPDETLYNGAICIEADFREGIVYAVCYSDRAECFSYDGARGVNISVRDERARRELEFGYYGEQYLEERE